MYKNNTQGHSKNVNKILCLKQNSINFTQIAHKPDSRWSVHLRTVTQFHLIKYLYIQEFRR